VLKKLAMGVAIRRAARFMPIYRVIAIAEMGLLAKDHVNRLDGAERRRLAHLVRHRRTLEPAERDELRALTAKLSPREFVGAAAAKVSPVPLPRRITGVPKKQPRRRRSG
jgi:hypothetical protein